MVTHESLKRSPLLVVVRCSGRAPSLRSRGDGINESWTPSLVPCALRNANANSVFYMVAHVRLKLLYGAPSAAIIPLDRSVPRPKRSRTHKTRRIDSSYGVPYVYPGESTPDSTKALYVIAWK
eukprot:scaffold284417_cov40-Tisochrysis_lutea.AAC.1